MMTSLSFQLLIWLNFEKQIKQIHKAWFHIQYFGAHQVSQVPLTTIHLYHKWFIYIVELDWISPKSDYKFIFLIYVPICDVDNRLLKFNLSKWYLKLHYWKLEIFNIIYYYGQYPRGFHFSSYNVVVTVRVSLCYMNDCLDDC